jgi:thioredoxin reductase (NADPH)
MIHEFNPAPHESNTPGIYLACVFCGGIKTGKWFIENAHYQTVEMMRNISAKINN